MNLRVIHPIHCSGRGVTYTCLSVSNHMQTPGLSVRLMVPAADPPGQLPFVRQAIPPLPFLKAIVYRYYRSETRLADLTARRFLKTLQRDDAVYIWPGTPLWLYREVNRRGHLLVMERINCHRATARRILDDAYQRLGLTPTHGITDQATAGENNALELADYVFSPAPNVEHSLIDAGVPRDKILPASYGWDPDRVAPIAPPAPRADDDGLVALFLGRIGIRKGVHRLLEAWAAAQVRGRLVLAGGMEPEIKALCGEHLSRPDVQVLPFAPGVAQLFAAADVFAFPTLEEGSPLVVYEALGSGVPVLTTPMGAGEIVRDGVEGLVRPAYDTDAWVTAFRELARDRDRLTRMGQAARQRAQLYTWPMAGRRRADLLRQALGAPSEPAPALTPVRVGAR